MPELLLKSPSRVIRSAKVGKLDAESTGCTRNEGPLCSLGWPRTLLPISTSYSACIPFGSIQRTSQ